MCVPKILNSTKREEWHYHGSNHRCMIFQIFFETEIRKIVRKNKKQKKQNQKLTREYLIMRNRLTICFVPIAIQEKPMCNLPYAIYSMKLIC